MRLPLADESVHCVVTSPPHWSPAAFGYDGLGSEVSPLDYALALLPAMREVRRVLRDDGTIWLHLGRDKYLPGGSLAGCPWTVARALRDALGLLIRAEIVLRAPAMPAADRPGDCREIVFLLAKSRVYRYDPVPIPDLWPSGGHRYGDFASLPERIVSPFILAGCPPGGTVLDPFCGTGTVPRVAESLGRKGVGFDLSSDHFAVGLKP
ncbi:MAG TPA: site-specific DNA-methyltransferase [Planctomycetota bacterium]|nr:site-specific DNA-methyltransferase [Planctomycetota bacterium]